MNRLPLDVVRLGKMLTNDRKDQDSDIAKKLIRDTPELVAMWRALEKRRHPDDPWNIWVRVFLASAREASRLPPYHYKSANERRKLAKNIGALARRLSRALNVNGLDKHLIYNNGRNFNGFFFYEDFGESNRERIDADGVGKLSVAEFISDFAKRVQQEIANEPQRGKLGKNAPAIRYVRLMVKRNRRLYGTPLNAVVAASANAIYATPYTASDIRKLISR